MRISHSSQSQQPSFERGDAFSQNMGVGTPVKFPGVNSQDFAKRISTKIDFMMLESKSWICRPPIIILSNSY